MRGLVQDTLVTRHSPRFGLRSSMSTSGGGTSSTGLARVAPLSLGEVVARSASSSPSPCSTPRQPLHWATGPSPSGASEHLSCAFPALPVPSPSEALVCAPCPLSHAGTFLCKAASLHLASPRLRHAILRHAGGTVRLSLLPPAPSLPPALSITSASEKVPHQRAGAPPRHQLQRERRRTHPGPPSRDNRPVLRDAGAGAQWQDRPLPLPRLLCHQCPGRGRHRGNGLAVRGGLAVRNTVHLLALRCRRTSPSPSQGDE